MLFFICSFFFKCFSRLLVVLEPHLLKASDPQSLVHDLIEYSAIVRLNLDRWIRHSTIAAVNQLTPGPRYVNVNTNVI